MSSKLDRRAREIVRGGRAFTVMRLPLLCHLTAIVLAGCSTPNPNTPAGQAEIAGQKCTVCIVENPGDGAPCYAICMQRVEDQAAYMKAYGH
jgi:hypothetical protein